jgi:hypothetical protein
MFDELLGHEITVFFEFVESTVQKLFADSGSLALGSSAIC